MKEVLPKNVPIIDTEAFSKRYQELIKVDNRHSQVWKMQSELEDIEDLCLSGTEKELIMYRINCADDVLRDIMSETADVLYDSELFEDIFRIWEESEDKKSVEMLFFRLFNVTFYEFLDKCESLLENKSQEKVIEKIENLYRNAKSGTVKRLVQLVLEVESASKESFSDGSIIADIKQELSCASNNYKIVSFDVENGEKGDSKDE